MPDAENSITSRNHGVIVWVSALGIIAAGGYLSHIAWLGHEWISRAGCLIVVLGIWSGLGSLIQERILLGRMRWQRRNAIVRTRAELEAKDTDPAEVEREVSAIEDAFDKRSHDLAQKLKVSLGIMEVSILITGTLLWGFGDIIAQYVFHV